MSREKGLKEAALLAVIGLVVFGLIRTYTGGVEDHYSLAASLTVRVNMNRDAAEKIELLPGVGPTLARRIVDEREANGPFETLDGLATRVAGIGPKTVARFRDQVDFGQEAADVKSGDVSSADRDSGDGDMADVDLADVLLHTSQETRQDDDQQNGETDERLGSDGVR